MAKSNGHGDRSRRSPSFLDNDTDNGSETYTETESDTHTEGEIESDSQYESESQAETEIESEDERDDSRDNNREPDSCADDAVDTEDDDSIIVSSERRTRSKPHLGKEPDQDTDNDTESKDKKEASFIDKLNSLVSQKELDLFYPPQFSRQDGSLPVESFPESQILRDYIAMEQENDDQTNTNIGPEDPSVSYEYLLDDFCVYRSPDHPRNHKAEYEDLATVASEIKQGHWLVDGTLQHDDFRQPFKGGTIVDVSIEGFEDTEQHSTRSSIFIQTEQSRENKYWYRLCSPTKAYSRYWSQFVWQADFAKFFIDYLSTCASKGIEVRLSGFTSDFWTWLRGLHGEKIRAWHDMCHNQSDFRQHVIQFAGFLENQAHSIYSKDSGSEQSNLAHPIWSEISARGISTVQEQSPGDEKTVVTANVKQCFSNFELWNGFDLLETVAYSPQVEKERERKRVQGRFANKFGYDQSAHFRQDKTKTISKARWLLEEAGVMNRTISARLEDLLRKVIVVRVDSKGQTKFRYAWVRAASSSKTRLSVIWLLVPSKTTCWSGFYPIGNELFFSDKCNCHSVSIRDVVMVLNASVFTDHAEDGCDLFVCGSYLNEQDIIVTASESDLQCRCEAGYKRSPKKQPSPQNINSPKLVCWSLFSGCGLFDYGFCSPGYAEVDTVVEKWPTAILSYRANDRTGRTRYENLSVNQKFREIAQGDMPLPQVNCLIGGPPCPGYSKLNAFRKEMNGQRNCSLLANTLSWVEVLLPEYVLIENVPEMDPMEPNASNACRQAVCHLVTLGYQVRVTTVKDSDLGGSSIRIRLFIVAAAPSAVLPDDLVSTHGPEGSGLLRERTVRTVIGDLDPVDNDMVFNIVRPRHVPVARLRVNTEKGVNFRDLLKRIPSLPRQMSLRKAYDDHLLKPHEREFFETLRKFAQRPRSRVLTRIDPKRPFRTICTQVVPMNSVSSGECLHPDQDRVITLEEAMRAQGMPASFLLVGNIKEQYKQVGNAVPWTMGASWGRSFGKAWRQTLQRRHQAGEGVAREDNERHDGNKLSRKRARPSEEDLDESYETDDSVVFVKEGPVSRG